MVLTRDGFCCLGLEPETGVVEDYKEGGSPAKITFFPLQQLLFLNNGSVTPYECTYYYNMHYITYSEVIS